MGSRSLIKQHVQIDGSGAFTPSTPVAYAELTGRPYESNLTFTVTSGSNIIGCPASLSSEEVGNYIVVVDSVANGVYYISSIDGSNATVTPTPTETAAAAGGSKHYFKNLEDDLNYIRAMLYNISGEEATWHTIPGTSMYSMALTLNTLSETDTTLDGKIDTTSGTLQAAIDNKADSGHDHSGVYSPVGHDHDSSYYTKNEVDTLSGTLQSEIDYTQIGAGLNTDGTYTAPTYPNTYLSESTSIKDATEILDQTIYTLVSGAPALLDTINELADALGDDPNFAVSTLSGIAANTDEINLIEAAIGLNTDGTFSPFSSTNYLDTATTISGALEDLDTALAGKSDSGHDHSGVYSPVGHDHDSSYYTKNEIDTLSGTLQSEIDGKADSGHDHSGVYSPVGHDHDSSYANISVESELDTTQVGAGLTSSGTYSPDMSTNYISAATSLANADSLLDDQIKINADNIAALSGTLDGQITAIDTFKYFTDGTDIITADGNEDTLNLEGAGNITLYLDSGTQTVTISGTVTEMVSTNLVFTTVSGVGDVWESTLDDFTIVPDGLQVFYNGVKQRDNTDYYTASIVSGKLRVQFTFETIADNWVNAIYNQPAAASGLKPWILKTSNYTASNGDRIIIDTTVGGSFTVTLPASPSMGNEVCFLDGGSYCTTSGVTVARNGSNIMGTAEDMSIDTDDASFSLVYYNTSKGWRLND